MIDDPRIAALGIFTPEGALTPGYGDHYLFFVGRDDCHGILKTLIAAEKHMLKLNMFGYDDDELDQIIEGLIKDAGVKVQATLDRSQAGGVHEKKIVAAAQANLGEEFGTSFAIGQSATHQISHTKGGVLVGQGLGWEGSMNWSDSGEGAGINVHAVKQAPGWKAQNNTLLVSANPVFLLRFGARLDVEHATALQQTADRAAKAASA